MINQVSEPSLLSNPCRSLMLYTLNSALEYNAYFFHSECNKSDADAFCKESGSVCVYSSTDPKEVVCLCYGVPGFVVAKNETCTGMYVY